MYPPVFFVKNVIVKDLHCPFAEECHSKWFSSVVRHSRQTAIDSKGVIGAEGVVARLPSADVQRKNLRSQTRQVSYDPVRGEWGQLTLTVRSAEYKQQEYLQPTVREVSSWRLEFGVHSVFGRLFCFVDLFLKS